LVTQAAGPSRKPAGALVEAEGSTNPEAAAQKVCYGCKKNYTDRAQLVECPNGHRVHKFCFMRTAKMCRGCVTDGKAGK